MKHSLIVVFLQYTLIEKLPILLVNTLLLYIPLLALTDRRTEEQIHSLRVGWRNFFSSCAVVSVFWFWWEIGFGVTYLCTLSTMQLWHCVSFLVLVGYKFWCYIRT
jgi:hypothetical protein